MFLAELNGHRIPALGFNVEGTICPICKQPVIAKSGSINAWHYAHKVGSDCDTWAEPVGPWHLAWQKRFPTHMQEVTIGNHRADIHTGRVTIELQHSGISVEEIQERERFYGPRMMWIFDATKPMLEERFDLTAKTDYWTFTWRQARRTIRACKRPVFLHLGQGLVLAVRRVHKGPPMRGWGQLMSEEDIVSWAIGTAL